jgi:hypothetical protein
MMGELWSKPLFEIRPDLFPEGYLTSTEIQLWNIHYKEKERNTAT